MRPTIQRAQRTMPATLIPAATLRHIGESYSPSIFFESSHWAPCLPPTPPDSLPLLLQVSRFFFTRRTSHWPWKSVHSSPALTVTRNRPNAAPAHRRIPSFGLPTTVGRFCDEWV